MDTPLLPKTSDTFGVWVGDAGVYVSGAEKAVVIAKCIESKETGFVRALAVADDGSIRFQYEDANGKLHFANVSRKAYEKAIFDMLDSLVGLVKLPATDETIG